MLRAYLLGLLDQASNCVAQARAWQTPAALVVFFLILFLIVTMRFALAKGKGRNLELPFTTILTMLILIDCGLLVGILHGSC